MFISRSLIRPGPVLIVAEQAGGPGLLDFIRECKWGGGSFYILVPLRPQLRFVAPFGTELGLYWPVATQCFEEREQEAVANAASILSHLLWLVWEMGAVAAGETVRGDIFHAVLNSYGRVYGRSVAVHSTRRGVPHISAKRLVKRLAEHVPATLVNDRRATQSRGHLTGW